MEQKSCQKFIYKLHSKQLRESKWDLKLPLNVALKDYTDCIISLGDSQVLRFIDELNGVTDADKQAREIKIAIKDEKKKPRSRQTRIRVNCLYQQLYELQFQEDYLFVIMDRKSDYDRANKGFKVNGIKYRRFLGTNGGIKQSTIVYVSERLYPELKRRLDNGRNMDMELVPAKLEAYQALICSGSTAVPQPKGVIVVNDCITHFKEDVIMINDENDGEPVMTNEKDFEIEHNDSDGYGLMLPSYSKRVNEYLTGNNEVISGMNTRWAWNKGMVYTFDFVEFGEKVAGTYEVIDAWGDKRDVRNAEVILTTSMLKLWDCYKNWEDYYDNCRKNHYEFSTTKTTPDKLENVRNTNYQFLQSYDFTDDELQELCNPTIQEIKDVLGMDCNKSIVFMTGFGLTEKNAFNGNYNYCAKALMADKRMINDPFIRRRIWNMICKRIEMAKRGAIKVNANYAMISGDPYALCQSMFGMEITGLLKSGEVYHKYWIDKGASEITCFRAPMTCHNNIRRMKLCLNEQANHWYQYIRTALIFNPWDSACDAMNGADKDGDTNMCTDNPIILRNTLNSPTIMCVQRKAEKRVPSEDDIIQANKLAFNDDIGVVTNYITSMIERQAGFEKGSPEYRELSYRIMCGQLYQQNTIDRAKGIIAKPMPDYWYNLHRCVINDEDSEEDKKEKLKNQKIVAANKPYFMIYIYPKLKSSVKSYLRNTDYKAISKFNKYSIFSVSELEQYEPKTDEMIEYINNYNKYMPVGMNDCVVNKICHIFEKEFDGYLTKKYRQPDFDYTIMKSNVGYSVTTFNNVKNIYYTYIDELNAYKKESLIQKRESDYDVAYHRFAEKFRVECEKVCTNKEELCDIVLDLCYLKSSTKQFAWDVCGETILRNLLNKNDSTIHIPIHVDKDGDFEYAGEQFKMKAVVIGGNENDCTE